MKRLTLEVGSWTLKVNRPAYFSEPSLASDLCPLASLFPPLSESSHKTGLVGFRGEFA